MDEELIKRVCDLTCTKEDVVRDQTTIQYDTEYPFKKYYHVETIIGALNKYISHEWDDQTLAHWACIYNWIINGGFDDHLKEDMNSVEEFLKEVLTWDLDGLSFFSDDFLEEGEDVSSWFKQYRDLDYVWQTRKNWKGVYIRNESDIEYSCYNYAVLINDTTKEYMIIYFDYFDWEFEDEDFKHVSDEEFSSLIDELKEKQYNILSYSEESFYSRLSDDDE